MKDSRLLAAVPLFADVTPDSLRAVAENARVVSVARGEAFYRQGERAQLFFLLRRGRVKLSQMSPDGQEIILRVIGAGEPLGTIAAIEPDSAYPVTAVAVQPSEALVWDGVEMTSLMLRCPSVAINAARLMAQRLHDLQRQHREVMTERADRRIARALLRLLRHTGQAIGGGLEIAFPLSQQELAQMAGTTLFTVSRTLGHWESEGVLERGRRKVVIRQPETLLRIAGESPD